MAVDDDHLGGNERTSSSHSFLALISPVKRHLTQHLLATCAASIFSKMAARMAHIHWTAPTLMSSSCICGILFALGHHLFYASLAGKPTQTSLEGYHVLGMDVTTQQFNTAVGTAFAFLVRACLSLSISVAYFQILIWSVAKQDTKLVYLDAVTSALQNFVSLARVGAWWQRPWLWVLAVIAWLMPLASIITPATLSVGIASPPPVITSVPNVDFSSLNLVAPMADNGDSGLPQFAPRYLYAGPSVTVQRITDAVAAEGTILQVVPPAVNSTWDLDFNGPSLHCSQVSSEFQNAVLDNILDYAFVQTADKPAGPGLNCTHGPGYMAWHPWLMRPDSPTSELLPFTFDEPSSQGNITNQTVNGKFNNINEHGYPYNDLASFFVAIAPTLWNSTSVGQDTFPTLCQGKPWYKVGLATYHNTSTVMRCDMYNSSYQTTFSFQNGVQAVDVKNVKSFSSEPMVTLGQVDVSLGSANESDTSLQPQACLPSTTNITIDKIGACLFDPAVLSTLSYQAIMHAFIDSMTGIISLGDEQDLQTLITSTTKITSTVLALAPELAFMQSAENHNRDTSSTVQQRAAMWQQQPFSGLVNAAAAPNRTMPFLQALEQLFQNITLSLMSAPDLQPNTSSIYFPPKTEIRFSTRENIYLYAASKLWLAYGLAIGATVLITLLGLLAIFANKASFANDFSTLLRLSRGAGLSCTIEQADLSGREPLPDYAKKAMVRFSQAQMAGSARGCDYALVDREGKHDDGPVSTVSTQIFAK